MTEFLNKKRLAKKFDSAFEILNEAQQKAVMIIDGPVLVVAGPGTGKTQILALRIGYILKNTDTRPSNILCLTYTDAGAIAMRKRLLQFIGPEAYKVHVHTFHSFCNQVIQDNQEVFSQYSTLYHASELEKAQLFRELIDSFDYSHPLRKLKGNLYFEAKRMEKLFSLMKRESWTPKEVLEKISAEYVNINNDSQLFYKTTRQGHKAGDPKKDYYKRLEQMKTLEAAVEAFEPFQEKMFKAGRYDFDDMIHWVRTAFLKDESLLASYQERFLYLLVDEFQDTNGSQNQIVDLLCSYWDRPNIFTVGDDDQAIFRFQGANIENLIEFYNRYKPAVVVLENNYRSSQSILDHSQALIQNNHKRLINAIPGVNKKLIGASKYKGHVQPPEIREYMNNAQLQADHFQEIMKLHRQGVSLKNVAVIYRKHAQALNLIKALSQENIPIQVKQRTNILSEPLIRNLQKIMRYLAKEFVNPAVDETLLFEMMHYRFFDLPPVDVARISMYCWRNPREKKSIRQSIKDLELLESLEVSKIGPFITFSETIDYWLSQIPHVTLQVLFERILKRGHVFREIMISEQRTYLMQVLATFFNYLQQECQRTPELELTGFLERLDQMKEIDLDLPMHNLIRNKDGINFLTAHGAKGLEFDYVYLIGCNNRQWEKTRGRMDGYKLPSNIVDPSRETDLEDERRLFYVAMTRAKYSLVMSYAAEHENGMPLEPSRFIAEQMVSLGKEPIEKRVLESDTVALYEKLLTPRDQKLPLIDHELIDKALEKFALSPTTLNKYLVCPRTFYFENILRVPLAKSPYLGFGNAIHFSLQQILEWFVKMGNISEIQIPEIFREKMLYSQSHFTPKEYENYMKHGEMILNMYVNNNLEQWQKDIELIPEKNISHVTHRGVPIKGRIDLIERMPDHRVRVVDFKTGNMNNHIRRNQKLKVQSSYDSKGGDYWRQVVFYKILLEALGDTKLRMDIGQMSFVEPDKYGEFYHKDYLVDIGQQEIVSDQIVDVYEKLKKHEFDIDCKRYECEWCQFVKNDFVLPDTINQKDDEEPESLDYSFEGQMELDF